MAATLAQSKLQQENMSMSASNIYSENKLQDTEITTRNNRFQPNIHLQLTNLSKENKNDLSQDNISDTTSQRRRRMDHSPVSVNTQYELSKQNTSKLWKNFEDNLSTSNAQAQGLKLQSNNFLANNAKRITEDVEKLKHTNPLRSSSNGSKKRADKQSYNMLDQTNNSNHDQDAYKSQSYYNSMLQRQNEGHEILGERQEYSHQQRPGYGENTKNILSAPQNLVNRQFNHPSHSQNINPLRRSPDKLNQNYVHGSHLNDQKQMEIIQSPDSNYKEHFNDQGQDSFGTRKYAQKNLSEVNQSLDQYILQHQAQTGYSHQNQVVGVNSSGKKNYYTSQSYKIDDYQNKMLPRGAEVFQSGEHNIQQVHRNQLQMTDLSSADNQLNNPSFQNRLQMKISEVESDLQDSMKQNNQILMKPHNQNNRDYIVYENDLQQMSLGKSNANMPSQNLQNYNNLDEYLNNQSKSFTQQSNFLHQARENGEGGSGSKNQQLSQYTSQGKSALNPYVFSNTFSLTQSNEKMMLSKQPQMHHNNLKDKDEIMVQETNIVEPSSHTKDGDDIPTNNTGQVKTTSRFLNGQDSRYKEPSNQQDYDQQEVLQTQLEQTQGHKNVGRAQHPHDYNGKKKSSNPIDYQAAKEYSPYSFHNNVETFDDCMNNSLDVLSNQLRGRSASQLNDSFMTNKSGSQFNVSANKLQNQQRNNSSSLNRSQNKNKQRLVLTSNGVNTGNQRSPAHLSQEHQYNSGMPQTSSHYNQQQSNTSTKRVHFNFEQQALPATINLQDKQAMENDIVPLSNVGKKKIQQTSHALRNQKQVLAQSSTNSNSLKEEDKAYIAQTQNNEGNNPVDTLTDSIIRNYKKKNAGAQFSSQSGTTSQGGEQQQDCRKMLMNMVHNVSKANNQKPPSAGFKKGSGSKYTSSSTQGRNTPKQGTLGVNIQTSLRNKKQIRRNTSDFNQGTAQMHQDENNPPQNYASQQQSNSKTMSSYNQLIDLACFKNSSQKSPNNMLSNPKNIAGKRQSANSTQNLKQLVNGASNVTSIASVKPPQHTCGASKQSNQMYSEPLTSAQLKNKRQVLQKVTDLQREAQKLKTKLDHVIQQQSFEDRNDTEQESLRNNLSQEIVTRLVTVERLLRQMPMVTQKRGSSSLLSQLKPHEIDVVTVRMYNCYMLISTYFDQQEYARVVRYLEQNTQSNMNVKQMLSDLVHDKLTLLRPDLSNYVLQILSIQADSMILTQKHNLASQVLYDAIRLYNKIQNMHQLKHECAQYKEYKAKLNRSNEFGVDDYIKTKASYAECLMNTGKLHEAIEKYENVKRNIEREVVFDKPLLLVNVCNQLGNCYLKLNRLKHALDNYETSLTLINKMEVKGSSVNCQIQDSIIAKVCLNIGIISGHLGYADDSVKMHLRSLEYKQKQGRNVNKDEILTSYILISYAYMRVNDMDSAAKFMEDGVNLSSEIKGKFSLKTSQVITQLGQIYLKNNQFSDSIKQYETAGLILSKLETTNSTKVTKAEQTQISLELNKIYLQLVSIYLTCDRLEEAQKVVQILETRIQNNIDNDYSYKLMNELANVLRKNNNFKQAIQFYKKSLLCIKKQSKNSYLMQQETAKILINIASTEYLLQNLEESLKYYDHTLNVLYSNHYIHSDAGDPKVNITHFIQSEKAKVHLSMAHILRQIGNLQSAHSQYNKAIDALEKLKKDEQKSKDCVKMLMEARHSLKQLIKETQM